MLTGGGGGGERRGGECGVGEAADSSFAMGVSNACRKKSMADQNGNFGRGINIPTIPTHLPQTRFSLVYINMKDKHKYGM